MYMFEARCWSMKAAATHCDKCMASHSCAIGSSGILFNNCLYAAVVKSVYLLLSSRRRAVERWASRPVTSQSSQAMSANTVHLLLVLTAAHACCALVSTVVASPVASMRPTMAFRSFSGDNKNLRNTRISGPLSLNITVRRAPTVRSVTRLTWHGNTDPGDRRED